MKLVTDLKSSSTVFLVTGLLMSCASWRVTMGQPATQKARLNAETFQSIHKQIGPQPGESLWMTIPWLTDLHDARQKAAKEGKPLFLMASGKGLSIGMC